MKFQTCETLSGAAVIGGGTVVVPDKAINWTSVFVIGILHGG